MPATRIFARRSDLNTGAIYFRNNHGDEYRISRTLLSGAVFVTGWRGRAIAFDSARRRFANRSDALVYVHSMLQEPSAIGWTSAQD